jgi:hypothetical protein
MGATPVRRVVAMGFLGPFSFVHLLGCKAQDWTPKSPDLDVVPNAHNLSAALKRALGILIKRIWIPNPSRALR